jgi:hypothetical protein
MHGHNKAFESDPFSYVRRYAINHLSMKVYGEKDAFDFNDKQQFDALDRPLPGQYSAYSGQVRQDKAAIEAAGEGYFDLEPVSLQGGTVIYLRFVVPGKYEPAVEYGGQARGADPAIDAYWLGYVMPGMQGSGKARIPFVDLPKTAPAHPLMLTGAMNGCSLVVTLHPTDPTMLRVYHDSCHQKNTFEDDIVIARIDYTDEAYASANRRAPLLAPSAPTPAPGGARARSSSVGAPPPVMKADSRARSGSIGSAPVTALAEPMACIRTSYGDMEQYLSVQSGSGSAVPNNSVRVRTSFNFLYYDRTLAKWVAVSQPLETQPSVAQPVKSFFETETTFKSRQKAFRRRGVQVASPPSSPPWQGVLPY